MTGPSRVNHFAHRSAAERYASHRPDIHPLVMGRFKAFAGRIDPFGRALDVACGTGQSTRAVARVARVTIGVDSSFQMLAQALPEPRVTYLHAVAEALPVRDETFDLLTLGLAFHWLDRTRFLRQAHRVLRPGGWLVVYDHGCFTGRMLENPDFEPWATETYPARYPTPARNSEPLTDVAAADRGLELIGRDEFSNEQKMSADELVAYLLTQTNVIAAVEGGDESLGDVADWISGSVWPLFAGPRGTMLFRGSIVYVQKKRAG